MNPVSVAPTRGPHVLHVVPMLGLGGMELALSRVVNALVARGQRHSVVCLKGEADTAVCFDPSVRVYCMHAGTNDLSLPWRLWRLIREVKPSVVHARNWGAWPDVAMARLLVRPRPPLVFSFHGLTEVGPMPWKRRLAYRVLARMTTRMLTVCEAARISLAELTGLSPERIGVIPNGVDTNRFSPGAERPVRKGVVVGTAGSLTAVKNQAMLVEACSALADRGLDVDLRIAGEGPERDRLVQLAESRGMGRRMALMGHVSDVPAFLRELDIFVLPSLSEAHPNALLEAMACGLACIGTRVGGVPEVLDEGRCGLLVDSGDTGGLVSAMAALAADVNRRRGLGIVARERVRRAYSLDKMIEAYAALYEGLTRRSRRTEGVQ
jgi:glycosyltransferase involved in cell wall biosynthesis